MKKLILTQGIDKFRAFSSSLSSQHQSLNLEVERLIAQALCKFPACGTQLIYQIPENEAPALMALKKTIDSFRFSTCLEKQRIANHLFCGV